MEQYQEPSVSRSTEGDHPQKQSPAQGQFEPLLDPRQAAALLRLHQKTVVRLAREGRIPAIRVAKHWSSAHPPLILGWPVRKTKQPAQRQDCTAWQQSARNTSGLGAVA
jgi:excisionase family DNA binding protein